MKKRIKISCEKLEKKIPNKNGKWKKWKIWKIDKNEKLKMS